MQKQKLVILSSVWVEPNSSAAGVRMVQLIAFFRQQNFDVIYASTAAPSDFALDLKEMEVVSKTIQLNDASFDVFVRQIQPDIVLFDRFMVEEQFGWRVAKNCPNAIRLLDTEDLHCLRSARRDAYKLGLPFQNEMLFSDVAKREIAAIFRCDLTLVISEFEMELLENFFKISKTLLFYLPLFVEKTTLTQFSNRLPYSLRSDFVFIGNFLHEPNWNAVQVLKNEIWPELRILLPKAKLNIYGAYPSQKVLQLHQPKERFFVCGRAHNAAVVIEQARVLLAPIRFGAGIKGKLLDAMVLGTPTVTTSVGAEAMYGDLSWSGIIANNNTDFIGAAVSLFSDEKTWRQAQQNGFEIVKQRFAVNSIWLDLQSKMENLYSNLAKHRQENFTGAMLQHHSLQSTYYMSKWIEEKQKNKV